MPERWRVKPGTTLHLDRIDSSATPGAPGGRAATEEALPAQAAELAALQDRLFAERRRSLLLVLQGPDTAGKDGTIRQVFRGVNPQSTRVHAFGPPAGDETRHDFLWRVHRAAPQAGEIGIFNRSHYEDVLAVRVRKLVPEAVWRPRFDLINGFEALLSHEGTRIVKVYLHISKEEQRRRLETRLQDPGKRWKLSPEDVADRALWDGYRQAYDEALTRTSTDAAPWYVVPADAKWYRNWAVGRILVEALRAMDPQYPQPTGPLPDHIP